MTTLKDKLPPVSQLGPFIALAIACTIFGLTTDNFFSGANFALILQQVMVVGVIAIGQTLIILTAGIDLSCGMVMALGSIVMTKVAEDFGIPAPLAILLAKLGARRLVLTGLSADSCVLATAQGANMREYAVWVPQDAVAAITPARRRHALQVMAVGLGARVDAVRAVTGLFPDPA